MRLLIAQLSDMHFRADSNPIVDKAVLVADAIVSAYPGAQGCLVVYCGDIAFSGKGEEYAHALAFMQAVRQRLRARLPDECALEETLIPGNHDCDFAGPQEARLAIIETLLAKRVERVASDFIQICTAPQSQYFELMESLGRPVDVAGRLRWTSEIQVAGTTVRVHQLNTAWLSRLKEVSGQLYFPAVEIPDRQPDGAFVVTAMHHPYTWFQAENARALRQALESASDLILTGHEHDYAARTVKNEKGERSLYVEAAALQEHHARAESSFQTISVDLEEKRQRMIRFDHTGTAYEPTSDPYDWEPLHAARFRSRAGIDLSVDFAAWVDDLGVEIAHPTRASICRSDLFTYPDLKRVLDDPRAPVQLLKGEGLARLVNDISEVAILGSDASGKTTVAKQLVLDLLDLGHVPVYVACGGNRKWSKDNCVRTIEEHFAHQYSADQITRFRQTSRQLRTLILDDFHALRAPKAELVGVLAELSAFFGHVVLISDELGQQLSDLLHQRVVVENGETMGRYRLLPFGSLRRSELTERWLALDDGLALDQEKLAAEIIRAGHMMDVAVGKNFVPAHPVFLLPLLQTLAFNEPVNVGASTYGYFFEMLIRKALAARGSKARLDLYLGFMANVAWEMFERGTESVSEEDLVRWLQKFREAKLVDLQYGESREALIKAGILVLRNGSLEFKYDYIRFYFIALSIRDSLSRGTAREAVGKLVASLHEERSANVLLFLVHLTRDPLVIDMLVQRARAVFDGEAVATLQDEDVPSFDPKALEQPRTLNDAAGREFRRETLETMDRRREEASSASLVPIERLETKESIDEAFAETSGYIRQLVVAFKSLQILGQVAINFPGTLDGETKVAIVGEAAQLGLRTLGSMLRLIRGQVDALVQQGIAMVHAEFPDLSDVELRARAVESVAAFPKLVALGVVRRIAVSVGSPDLGPVYSRLMPEDSSPAMRLVHCALLLEQQAGFPEAIVEQMHADFRKNLFADDLLLSIVVHHLNVFEVKFDTKQRVCSVLGIAFKPLQGVRPRSLLAARR